MRKVWRVDIYIENQYYATLPHSKEGRENYFANKEQAIKAVGEIRKSFPRDTITTNYMDYNLSLL